MKIQFKENYNSLFIMLVLSTLAGGLPGGLVGVCILEFYKRYTEAEDIREESYKWLVSFLTLAIFLPLCWAGQREVNKAITWIWTTPEDKAVIQSTEKLQKALEKYETN